MLMRRHAKSATLKPLRLGVPIGLGLVVTTGCGPSLGHQIRESMSRYEVGNVNSAANICSGIETDGEADLNPKAHVRYLVYCGLTRYKLGDRKSAHPMLAQGAEEYVQGRASWLKPAIVDELYKALDDLDGRSGQPERSQRGRPVLSSTPDGEADEVEF